MPIYEYKCLSCSFEFQIRRAIADLDLLAGCTSCGKESKRLVSTFGAKNGLYVRAAGAKAFRGNPDELGKS
jgi:putative FmdB family regulatory protein